MNSESLTKKLEMGAYAAIIIMTLIVGIMVVPKWLKKDSAKRVPPPAALKSGDRIQIPNEDWANNKKTLVLVLSTQCHFCSESAPFYQRLVTDSSGKNIHLAAVFPQSAGEGRDYLNKLGVTIADIQQAPSSFAVRGTPTLILLDDKGAVIESWTGKLPANDETELMSKVLSD
jgi:thioredoxin-related protein